jgi:uncharacterized caspase-like protein
MEQVGLPVNNMNTARGYLAGFGTQTAALAFGGESPTLSMLQQNYGMEQVGLQVQWYCNSKMVL